MKSAIFLLFVFLVCFTGCGSNQVKQKNAGQIISNSWEGEDVLDEKDVWKTLRPPVIITKADSGDVVALFVGEFSPKWRSDNGQYHFTTIEIRIKVNDVIASPSKSMIITWMGLGENDFETRSFLASVRNLLPGTHTVTAEWRSKDRGVRVRNRTLTVWETVSP